MKQKKKFIKPETKVFPVHLEKLMQNTSDTVSTSGRIVTIGTSDYDDESSKTDGNGNSFWGTGN